MTDGTSPELSASRDPHAPGVISFELDELDRLKIAVARGLPFARRLSAGLAFRLSTSAQGDAEFVLQAIEFLEGLRTASNLKLASQFKHEPLRPLWHQHFVAPRHIIPNIGLHWGIRNGGKGSRDLDRVIAEVADTHGDKIDRWPGIIAHRFANGYTHRSQAGQLTGDWIIFAEHQGERYYLDLATHEEALPRKATRLLTKLKGSAAAEFPFAFKNSV